MNRPIYQVRTGTVIDHIPAGRGIQVVQILGLNQLEDVLAIGVNLDSKKYGKKDVIKIEDRFLEQEEIDKICLVAPHATISNIEDHEVKSKQEVRIPAVIINLIECRNPNCITNLQDEPTRFQYVGEQFCCEYCERCYSDVDLKD